MSASTPTGTYFEPDASRALLSIQDLVTEFRTESGTVRAIDGVSFDLRHGECLSIVGESGSGKSATVMSAVGLLPPAATVRSGHAYFDGSDLLAKSERAMNAVRGSEIGIVFQDPMTALNPVMTIGAQIDETLKRHSDLNRAERRDRVLELLADVGISSGRERIGQYPHQFSGGMRQRVMIAIAIANRPKLIIADEPTTALDVTIQAQILDLLLKVQMEVEASLLLITHDLGVVAEMADRVVVMYGGRVVEQAPVDAIFHDTRHPYTRSLLQSLPRMDDEGNERLMVVERPPMLASTGTIAFPHTLAEPPRRLVRVGDDHYVATDLELEGALL